MKKAKQVGSLVLAGPLPPPVHGFSAMNDAVRLQTLALNLDVKVLNLSPRVTPGQCGYNKERLLAYTRSLLRYLSLCMWARPIRLYIGVSGGWGQLADLLIVLIAKLFAQDVVMHHHSFAYLRRKSRIMTLMVRATGSNALHIVLCEAMADRLRYVYGDGVACLVLSNAALLAPPPVSPPLRRRLETVGMLSNLTLEKGVDVFIDILRRLRSRGCPVRGRLAGPADAETSAVILAAVEEGLVTWVGPVYGPAKHDFLTSIDAFVFPTRYINEAEPLVLHEALACGAPVIAADRGCIKSLVQRAGLVYDMASDGTTATVDLLEAWWARPQDFADARETASRRFTHVRLQAQQAYATCLARLAEGVSIAPKAGRPGKLAD